MAGGNVRVDTASRVTAKVGYTTVDVFTKKTTVISIRKPSTKLPRQSAIVVLASLVPTSSATRETAYYIVYLMMRSHSSSMPKQLRRKLCSDTAMNAVYIGCVDAQSNESK